MPHAIDFNEKDELSFKFIFYLVLILNRILEINLNINEKDATGYVRDRRGARTKQSFDNVVLAYLIEKEGYYHGYNNGEDSNGVRMRAIHEYLKTWYSDVGFYNNKTKSGLNINRKWKDSGFDLNNYSGIKKDVLAFIERAKDYARNYEGTVPTINKNNTSSKINGLSTKTAGPFKISYTGKIDKITVTNTADYDIKDVMADATLSEE